MHFPFKNEKEERREEWGFKGIGEGGRSPKWNATFFVWGIEEGGGDWRESPFDGPVFALLKRRS